MGRGVAVRDGITPVMTLEQDQATGLAKSITLGEKKYEFAYDGKPRIENIGGQKLVGGVEPSLHQITYPEEMGGKKETYDFAVTEQMLPELKITDTEGKERMIVWGVDGRMVKDGDWTYTMTPQSDPNARYASIKRINAGGQSELWNRDEAKGEEVTQGLDGVKKIKTWFTSGVLMGKRRKEITMFNNKIINQNSWFYDEKGKLIRNIQNNIKTCINGKYLCRFDGNSMKWKLLIQ